MQYYTCEWKKMGVADRAIAVSISALQLNNQKYVKKKKNTKSMET